MLGFGACGKVLYLALMFYTGYFVVHQRIGIDLESVLIASMISLLAMMGVGSQVQNIPSMAKAKEAAVPIFSIIDEPSSLDIRDTRPDQIKKIKNGSVTFSKVDF